jgi:hypothetical protein
MPLRAAEPNLSRHSNRHQSTSNTKEQRGLNWLVRALILGVAFVAGFFGRALASGPTLSSWLPLPGLFQVSYSGVSRVNIGFGPQRCC